MTVKKKVEPKLESKDDALEEKKSVAAPLVSVEMSEEQREAFTKFLADQKIEAAAEEDEIELDLKFQHNRSGVSYGPGRVTVAESIGYAMLEADDKSFRARMRVHEANDTLIEILGGGRSAVRHVKKISV